MIHERNPTATKELASHAELSGLLGPLITKLVEIRRSLVNQAAEFEERIASAYPLYQSPQNQIPSANCACPKTSSQGRNESFS